MILVLCLYGIAVGIKIAGNRFDVSHLVLAGDHFFDENSLIYPIAIEKHSDGYDGQFYYRLALNPFTTERVQYGISMESHPQVRVQRIVYPVVVWLLSFGRGSLVPYMMLAVNLASLLGLCWLGNTIARFYDLPARLGLLFPFYPGFLISITRDTVELLASFLSVLAFYLFLSKRIRLGALTANVAVLSRETTLFYLFGFGIASVYEYLKSGSGRLKIMLCLTPVVTLCLWNLVLRNIWGSFPFDDIGPHDISHIPLQGIVQWFRIYAEGVMHRPSSFREWFCLIALLIVPFFVFTVGRFAKFDVMTMPSLAPWVLYAALAALFTGAVWNEAYGFLRVLSDLFILGILSLMGSKRGWVLTRISWAVGFMWIATLIYVT